MSQTSNTMGVASISRGNIGDLQRNYLWEIKLPTVIGTTNVGTSIPGAVEKLAQDIIFGEYGVTANSLRVGQYISFYAGLLTIPQFQVIFLVPSPNILGDYLDTWKSLMVGSDGLFFPKSNYQANIYVNFLNPMGVVTNRFKMIGCFPTTFPIYYLDYKTSKLATVRIIFSVDKIEYTDLLTSYSS